MNVAFLSLSPSLNDIQQQQQTNPLSLYTLSLCIYRSFSLTLHALLSTSPSSPNGLFHGLRFGFGSIADMSQSHLFKGYMEPRDQLLGHRERKHQLGSNNQDLGQQALEEGAKSLIPDHLADDTDAAFRVIKVAVLDPGLDNVQRGSDSDRGDRSADGGAKVLKERRLVVVLELENIFLDEC